MRAHPAIPPAGDEDAAVKRRRRGRNIALLVILLALAVLFYGIALVKMMHYGASG